MKEELNATKTNTAYIECSHRTGRITRNQFYLHAEVAKQVRAPGLEPSA